MSHDPARYVPIDERGGNERCENCMERASAHICPDGERSRLGFERLAQLVDRAEEQGGFATTSYCVEVDGERLGLIDTIRFRELMMVRQRERERDRSEDFTAARLQGYEAAVNDMLLALRGLREPS